MRKNFIPKYTYHTNFKDTVVAVCHYAGRPVRGIAKCSPADDFDLEVGKELAKARCDLKIANKKVKNLKEDIHYWAEIRDKIEARLENLYDVYDAALEKRDKAEENFADILTNLK